MAFDFPAGEAITHSHSSREPKIDDLGVLLASVFFFFFYFTLSLFFFNSLCILPSKIFLSSQGKYSSTAALEPSL